MKKIGILFTVLAVHYTVKLAVNYLEEHFHFSAYFRSYLRKLDSPRNRDIWITWSILLYLCLLKAEPETVKRQCRVKLVTLSIGLLRCTLMTLFLGGLFILSCVSSKNNKKLRNIRNRTKMSRSKMFKRLMGHIASINI